MKNIIYWLPRVLGIAFILFLSLFALDVFGEYSGWQLLTALFMHLLPEIILVFLIIFAWKNDLIEAIFFLGFAIYFVLMSGFKSSLIWYLLIPGPALLVAILFVISWFKKK
jgi:predicted lysophospholipase L1 biosynthesis ABC-type transport system permease subunit